jgi:intraflagellar transport protein 81
MKRDEFKAYAAALRTKTATFKTLKAALGEARQESVVLARTEALLRARATDMDAFLARLEEKKGVAGYTGVASSLEEVSALKSRIDESKAEHAIAVRLTRQLNRELKAQLSVESRRAAKLERELEAAAHPSSARSSAPRSGSMKRPPESMGSEALASVSAGGAAAS